VAPHFRYVRGRRIFVKGFERGVEQMEQKRFSAADIKRLIEDGTPLPPARPDR
jgi:hypothetical protein